MKKGKNQKAASQQRRRRHALISVADKPLVLEFAQDLVELDFVLYATNGTAQYLESHGVRATNLRSYIPQSVIDIGNATGTEVTRFGGLCPEINQGLSTPKPFRDHVIRSGALWFDLLCVTPVLTSAEGMFEILKSYPPGPLQDEDQDDYAEAEKTGSWNKVPSESESRIVVFDSGAIALILSAIAGCRYVVKDLDDMHEFLQSIRGTADLRRRCCKDLIASAADLLVGYTQNAQRWLQYMDIG